MKQIKIADQVKTREIEGQPADNFNTQGINVVVDSSQADSKEDSKSQHAEEAEQNYDHFYWPDTYHYLLYCVTIPNSCEVLPFCIRYAIYFSGGT